jgi:hypothetical protein
LFLITIKDFFKVKKKKKLEAGNVWTDMHDRLERKQEKNKKIVEIVVEMCLCCVTIMETLVLFLFLWWTAGCVEFPSSSFFFFFVFSFNLRRKNKKDEQKSKRKKEGRIGW